jgi:hypothetical protein
MPQKLRQSQEQQGNPTLHLFSLLSGEGEKTIDAALLPLTIIGISGTPEPRNAVGLQGIFALTGPLI